MKQKSQKIWFSLIYILAFIIGFFIIIYYLFTKQSLSDYSVGDKLIYLFGLTLSVGAVWLGSIED